MKNIRSFYRCPVCGNMVGLIEDGGGVLVCCGQDMLLLAANSQDASQEKHVPVVERKGDKCIVKIGSAAHPMTDEHHIAWVALAQGKTTQRATLDINGAPATEFCVGDGPLTVYAYCNLHGLWLCEA